MQLLIQGPKEFHQSLQPIPSVRLCARLIRAARNYGVEGPALDPAALHYEAKDGSRWSRLFF